MPKNSFADDTFDWSQLLSGVAQHADDVEFLEDLSAELRLILNSVTELERERLALKARSQQITRDLDALKTRGRGLAGRIRSGLRTRYGYSSERLTVFGMSPRRRRVQDVIAEETAVAKITGSDPAS